MHGSRYLCSGADHSVRRIATSEEGVPAPFGGVVSPDLINAFTTSRTKPNMNPPTTVPYVTEAGAQSQPSMACGWRAPAAYRRLKGACKCPGQSHAALALMSKADPKSPDNDLDLPMSSFGRSRGGPRSTALERA